MIYVSMQQKGKTGEDECPLEALYIVQDKCHHVLSLPQGSSRHQAGESTQKKQYFHQYTQPLPTDS